MAPEHEVRTLFLSLTQRCNLTCSYCSADAGPDRSARMDPAVARERVANWIAGAEAGPLQLILTGGEPLLWGRDALESICREARAMAAWRGLELALGIQTNGTLVDDWFIALCRDYGLEPSISLDGPPELSDAHRGRGERIVANLERLQRAGIGFGLIACLTGRVLDEIEAVLAWMEERGFRKVRFNDIGVAPPGREAMEVEADRVQAAWRAIYVHMFERPGTRLRDRNMAARVERFDAAMCAAPVAAPHCETLRCGAGRYLATVNPDGRWGMCVEKSMADGLPAADSLGELAALNAELWGELEGWDDCATCPATHICDKGCVAYHRKDKGTFATHCRATKRFWAWLAVRRPAAQPAA